MVASFATTYTIAHFCRIIREVHISPADHYWVCAKHGRTQLVPYYGFTNRAPVHACPTCIEDHLGKKTVVSAYDPPCSKCKGTADVVACEGCGEFVCSLHRNGVNCYECQDIFPHYHGL